MIMLVEKAINHCEIRCFKTITAPTSFATTYSIAPVLAKEGAVIVFKALKYDKMAQKGSRRYGAMP